MINIPFYHQIDELLHANETGLKASMPYFHINRLEDLNWTHDFASKPAHRTDFYGINLFLSGQGSMTINSHSADYALGMLAFTAPGQVVSWEKKSGLKGYNLFFKSEFLPSSQFASVPSEFHFFKIEAETMVLLGEECTRYTDLFQQILIEYQKQEPNFENVIRSYLLLLLHLFKRSCDLSGHPSEQPSRKMQVVNAFEALARKDLPNRKPIKEYAELLFVSEKHLIETLKEVTGKTPAEYIQDIFLNEAKTLLTHTPYTVAEIAYRLNFQDPSYFNKVFKKHFQVTPLEFRNGK